MNKKPCDRLLITLAVVCAGVGAALTGCQGTPPATPAPASAPATNWTSYATVTFGGKPTALAVSAAVTKIGPPTWCYSVESFDVSQRTNANYVGEPMPGNPAGYLDAGSFTNITVSAPACSGTNSTPGWSVVAGSQVAFTYSGAAPRNSLVQFCLTCDKTNGTVTINVTSADGVVTSIGPIAGPQ